MEFLWAFLILAGFWALTTLFSSILGLIIPITYMVLGFIFGMESIIIGLGGLIGNIINLIFTNKYINTHGAMSNAPRLSELASIGFIIVFVVSKIINSIYEFELNDISYLYFIPFVIIAWLIVRIFSGKKRQNSVGDFYESVVKYKVIEKYDDNPKWATYLFFKDGAEGWNQTIAGSFLAKHPKDDLTFVHTTKDEAVKYAEEVFKNAQYIDV